MLGRMFVAPPDKASQKILFDLRRDGRILHTWGNDLSSRRFLSRDRAGQARLVDY